MVLGSRMAIPGGAARGGMPAWKRVANRFLTTLREPGDGPAVHRVPHRLPRVLAGASWRRCPFLRNANGFVFDTEVIFQAVQFGLPVVEVPIQTRYFDDVSSVNFSQGVVYGLGTLWTAARFLLNRWGVVEEREVPAIAMAACVFCAIHADPARAAFVYEDEHVGAFLDHRPLFPGHVLVVPARAPRDPAGPAAASAGAAVRRRAAARVGGRARSRGGRHVHGDQQQGEPERPAPARARHPPAEEGRPARASSGRACPMRTTTPCATPRRASARKRIA